MLKVFCLLHIPAQASMMIHPGPPATSASARLGRRAWLAVQEVFCGDCLFMHYVETFWRCRLLAPGHARPAVGPMMDSLHVKPHD